MRKILILNGILDDSLFAVEEALGRAAAARAGDGVMINVIRLRDKNVKYCTGCWNCWVKTPGICMHKDDLVEVYPEILKADLLIFLSPKSMSFVTSLVKKTCDRMIPLVHPYFEIYKNELHHMRRYNHVPQMGLLLIDPEKNDEDMATIRTIFERLAINLRAEFVVSSLISDSASEVENAISSL